ncbi:MAG: alpha/beta fold hydrolase [Ktedonobacterales bacterium]|nr:alpha/beta fold hydrolase [Ktedonobacterales bacterium]
MTQAQPGTSGYATIGDAHLFYEVAGQGHPLVLLHAGIADSRMWNEQFPAFAAHYRVLRYDMRGFGQSALPPGPFSHVANLRALLAFLEIDSAYVLGLSMGGTTAINFALEHPALVDALLVVGATPEGYSWAGEAEERLWSAIATAEQDGDRARAIELELQMWVDGPYRRSDAVAPAVRERVREMNTRAYALNPEMRDPEPITPPAAERLHAIHIPTHFVAGALDRPGMIAAVSFCAAAVPGARQTLLAGGAHMVNMERPAEFNQLALDFFGARGEIRGAAH